MNAIHFTLVKNFSLCYTEGRGEALCLPILIPTKEELR